jgi:hypothetical protein
MKHFDWRVLLKAGYFDARRQSARRDSWRSLQKNQTGFGHHYAPHRQRANRNIARASHKSQIRPEDVQLAFPREDRHPTQTMIIHVAIACPGKNLLLQGHAGYGRHVPTPLAVHIEECDFVSISLQSEDIHDCIPMLFSLMSNVVTNAVLRLQKRSYSGNIARPTRWRSHRLHRSTRLHDVLLSVAT